MNQNKRPIGIFDSGIGGLTVLEQMIKLYPNENFYYVADQGHCPYGTKTPEQIGERVYKVASHLASKGAKAIVIACNTASIHIAEARKATDVPVVSVIQPTCQHAINTTKNNKVAVLATIATINNGIYQQLLTDANVTPVPLRCSEFVDFVENNDLNDPKGDKIVADKLAEIKDEGFDTLIHGCTHFSLVEPQMRKVLGDINYVACGEPTGKYLGEILAKQGLLNDSTEKGTVEIYTTGSVENALANMKWFKAEHKPVTHVDID